MTINGKLTLTGDADLMSVPSPTPAERTLKLVAWVLLIALAVVTIGPLSWRPITPLPTQVERMLGLAVVGFAFGIAYPRRLLWVVALLFVATAAFEALQLVEPSRHGRIFDLLVKLVGAAIGIALAWVVNRRPIRRI